MVAAAPVQAVTVNSRSGIGLVERAILEALDALNGQPGQDPAPSNRVLAAVEERIGLAPGYAYDVLLDLARPWTVPVRLARVGGNLGSRGNDPAANPRYTGAQLSPPGKIALAAERSELAPVPIGLINGNTYRDGSRPPFRPSGVIEAVRRVLRHPDISADDLTAIVGPPDFLTGCTATGDFAALAAGQPVMLQLRAQVSIGEDRRSVIVQNLPPNANPDEVVLSLARRASEPDWAARHPGLNRATRLPLAGVRDLPTHSSDRFVCTPEPGTEPGLLAEQLLDIYGISTAVRVALPGPLPDLIKNWARSYPGEELLTSLAALEKAIASQ